jgi:O-antigen ligase
MLRLLFYDGLMAAAIGATLLWPPAGAFACVAAYLLNPSVITGDDSVRFQLLITLAFAASVLIHRPRRLPSVGHESMPIVLLWVFVALGYASAAWAEVSASQAIDQITELLKTVILASLIVASINEEKQFEWLVTACILGVAHAAFAHTFGVRFGYVPSRYGRDDGVVPDGQTAVMVIFVPLLITTISGGSFKQKVLALLTLPLALNSIVSTYLRTGLVSLVVEGVLLILLMPRRFVLRALPMIAIAIALFVYRLTPEDYWNRMDTIQAPGEEASAASRFVIADASMKMLADYPFGVGYRNYPDVSPRYLPPSLLTEGRRSAHNSFFSVACETGIQGFVVWISAFGGAVLLLRRVRKKVVPGTTKIAAYALGLEVGIYGWLAGGMTQADHEVDPAYWFVAFAVILTRLHALRLAEAPAPAEAPAFMGLALDRRRIGRTPANMDKGLVRRPT